MYEWCAQKTCTLFCVHKLVLTKTVCMPHTCKEQAYHIFKEWVQHDIKIAI